MKMFPAYLYTPGEAGKADKRLFKTPHEVPPGKWFADRELKQPYQAPLAAPVPATPEHHVRALEAALAHERAAHAKTVADFEQRVAALEKGKGKGKGDDKGGD